MVTEVTHLSRIRTSERDRAPLVVTARSPRANARKTGFRRTGHISYQIILKLFQNIKGFEINNSVTKNNFK